MKLARLPDEIEPAVKMRGRPGAALGGLKKGWKTLLLTQIYWFQACAIPACIARSNNFLGWPLGR